MAAGFHGLIGPGRLALPPGAATGFGSVFGRKFGGLHRPPAASQPGAISVFGLKLGGLATPGGSAERGWWGKARQPYPAPRRWKSLFYVEEWGSKPEAKALPQSQVRTVRGRLVPDSDTSAPGVLPGGAGLHGIASLGDPLVTGAADALLSAVRDAFGRATSSPGRAPAGHIPQHDDDDIAAMVLAMLALDED